MRSNAVEEHVSVPLPISVIPADLGGNPVSFYGL